MILYDSMIHTAWRVSQLDLPHTTGVAMRRYEAAIIDLFDPPKPGPGRSAVHQGMLHGRGDDM